MKTIPYPIALIFFLVISVISHGQTSVQTLEERLTFEVKNIEDFINRFNFIEGNDFLKTYRQKYPNSNLTRQEIIKTLFAKTNNHFIVNEDSINKFINHTINTPFWLNFYYPGWYALVDCKFERQGKEETVKLTLEIECDTSYACKWVISGIKSNFTSLQSTHDASKFMNPVSYATDFMNLDAILNDKKNLAGYMNSNFKPSPLSVFIGELRSGKLNFLQVNNVTYYFLQVPDYSIEVKYFGNNESLNGWLISNLSNMDEEVKSYFVYKSLGVQ